MVTISREFGSGGGHMAAALARRLEWRILDRELVQRVAQELGVAEEEVAERDEHVAGIGERVSAFLADAFPEMLLPPPPSATIDHDTVQVLIEATLREVAESPPLVVVGHGAQCIFGSRPGTLHVRVQAPLEERIRRVAARLALDPDAARTRIREEDGARAQYMRRSYGIDIDDRRHYDLIVSTGRLGIDEAARALAELVVASRERTSA